MKRLRNSFLAILVLFFGGPIALAQTGFKGILINKANNEVVKFGRVYAPALHESTIIGEDGTFELAAPDTMKTLVLLVSVMGAHDSVAYVRRYKGKEKVYINIAPTELAEFQVQGLSPLQVLQKAVRAVKTNYADRSYFGWSSYREYERVNNIFRNLEEGDVVVLNRVRLNSSNELNATEGYAERKYRRVVQFEDKSAFYDDDPSELISQEPLYHLRSGALNPSRLVGYRLSFDTTQKGNDYVIKYVNYDYSMERHGLVTQGSWPFSGEAYEKGVIVVDRRSFAIKRIERHAYRNKDYIYWKHGLETNVVAWGKYTIDFVDAHFITDYDTIHGKWYPKHMYYEYTNRLERTVKGHDNYDMVTCFEWRLDSVSRGVPGELLKSFHDRLVREHYNYDKTEWTTFELPYYFYPQDTVYSYLQRRGPLEEQFADRSKVDHKEYLNTKP